MKPIVLTIMQSPEGRGRAVAVIIIGAAPSLDQRGNSFDDNRAFANLNGQLIS
jgi:hypothetical protein